MLYGISIALSQVQISNDAVLDNCDSSATEFFTPSPDTPLSTR
jgi:hypothetical protein